MLVFPEIMVPPNHPILIGFSMVFHDFHHPFWGPTPIFGNTQMYLISPKTCRFCRVTLAKSTILFRIHLSNRTRVGCPPFSGPRCATSGRLSVWPLITNKQTKMEVKSPWKNVTAHFCQVTYTDPASNCKQHL